MSNPFEAPSAATSVVAEPGVEDAAPYDARLFHVTAIGLAAFFSGPFAGGLLLGLNFWWMRRPLPALLVWVCGCALALGRALAAEYMLVDKLQAFAIHVLIVVFAFAAARTFQGAAIARHRALGRCHSDWAAFGLAVMINLAVVAVNIAFP